MLANRRIFISTLLLLLSSGTWAQQSYIEHTKTWSPQRGAYLDSVYKVFQSPRSEDEKFQAALQLYGAFNFPQKQMQRMVAKENFSEEELLAWKAQFKDIVLEQFEKGKYTDRLLEFEILNMTSLADVERVEALLKPTSAVYTERDSVFRAIWLVKKKRFLRLEKSIQSQPELTRHALSLAPKTEENLALVSNLCKSLGDGFYHNYQLDSAQHYYHMAAELYGRNKAIRADYRPAHGIFPRTEMMGNVLMNLGLVHERKGNLVKATFYYEEANAVFGLQNKEGVQWSNLRLMNAYFDSGDKRSGQQMLKRITDESLENLKGIRRYTPRFICNVLAEFELDEMRENGAFLDSMLTAEIKYLYGDEPIGEIEEKKLNDEAYLSFRARICFYEMMLSNMGFSAPIDGFNFAELQHWVGHHTSVSKQKSKFSQGTLMQSMLLVWKTVNTSRDSSEIYFSKLNRLFQSGDLTNEKAYALKQAGWVLALHGMYARQAELIHTLLPHIEETQHKVALKLLYHELATAYEKEGNFHQAIGFRNKHDALEAEINSINQHETLAALDKTLEVTRSQHDKALLELENETLRSKKNQLYIGTAGLTLVLLMAIGWLNTNRKRVTARKQQLEAEKEVLGTALEDESEKTRVASLEIWKGNQSLNQLIGDLEKLKDELNPQSRKKVLGLLLEYKGKAQEDSLQQFNLQFQKQHPNFYQNLQVKFPDLTGSEQRLCAMHFSQLTNKGINAITGQKLSSIHTMKSKIRKKVGVENDEGLLASLEEVV